MAVRVRIRFDAGSSTTLEAVGLLNGGFESDSPSTLLPERAAKSLFPRYPEGSRVVKASVATGEGELRAMDLPVRARIRVVDRDGPVVSCDVYVSPGADEVLMSDTAIDHLGVHIESFGKGIWRFTDEDRTRESEPPQFWSEGTKP